MTTYEALNQIGVVVHTFSDHRLALAWARRNASKWPGVKIEQVTRTETRKTLWTDHKFAEAKREARERRAA